MIYVSMGPHDYTFYYMEQQQIGIWCPLTLG